MTTQTDTALPSPVGAESLVRCQAMTVAGLAMIKAERQPGQGFDSHTQTTGSRARYLETVLTIRSLRNEQLVTKG